jgi:hypothetical protein
VKVERGFVHLRVSEHDLKVPGVDIADQVDQLRQHGVGRGLGYDYVKLEVHLQVISGILQGGGHPV